MRKYLPILPALGLLILVGGIFYVRGRQSTAPTDEEEALMDVALPDRPVASLTPSADGHTLKMVIDKIKIQGAKTVDYELLYDLPDGRTQGVPGTVDVSSGAKIERDLLLGSESSGKKRYDEGVEKGTFNLRFRNDKGKLIAKFSTDFHLQSKTKMISTVDDNVVYTLDKVPTKGFFVTMSTFGIPEMPTSPSGFVPTDNPVGFFSSLNTGLSGSINLRTAKRWTGTKWEDINNGISSGLGIFI